MFWLDRADYPGLPEVFSHGKVGVETLGGFEDRAGYDVRQPLSDIIEQDKLWIREEDLCLSKRKESKNFKDRYQLRQTDKSRCNSILTTVRCKESCKDDSVLD